jgi:hypothetical membrane protein
MEATAMTTTLPTQTSWLTRAGWVGLIGPVLFTLTWVAQELFRIEEYSPIKEPVSALAAGPNGWIQSVSFAVFGVLTIAFAVGLYRVSYPSKPGVVGSGLFLVSGLGLLMAAAFPLREDAAGVPYDPGGHFVAGMMFFTSSAIALVVISFAPAKRAEFRRLAMPVRVAGILMLVSNPVMGILVIPTTPRCTNWPGSRNASSYSACCSLPAWRCPTDCCAWPRLPPEIRNAPWLSAPSIRVGPASP